MAARRMCPRKKRNMYSRKALVVQWQDGAVELTCVSQGGVNEGPGIYINKNQAMCFERYTKIISFQRAMPTSMGHPTSQHMRALQRRGQCRRREGMLKQEKLFVLRPPAVPPFACSLPSQTAISLNSDWLKSGACPLPRHKHLRTRNERKKSR